MVLAIQGDVHTLATHSARHQFRLMFRSQRAASVVDEFDALIKRFRANIGQLAQPAHGDLVNQAAEDFQGFLRESEPMSATFWLRHGATADSTK